MADIRLVPIQTPDIVTLDWLQTPVGLIDETNELVTAVIVALCSDSLADPSDILPDPNSTDRRGWWGDYQADTIWNGWPIGSKLWLLTRAKMLTTSGREAATLLRVQQYITACLQPFVTAKLCTQFTVNAFVVNPQRIDARVMIYRGPKSNIALNFQAVWTELFPGSPLV
jgi:phage gp46-like protein